MDSLPRTPIAQHNSTRGANMPTQVIRGRYTDEVIIRRELAKFFPRGRIVILWERSRFFCTIPQALTDAQYDILMNAIEADHYANDNRVV